MFGGGMLVSVELLVALALGFVNPYMKQFIWVSKF